mgnify:CR=1 FL=1
MADNARYRRRHIIHGIWLPGWLIDPLRRCTHTLRRNIYGEEIDLAGGRRSRCLDCGRLLPDLAPEVNRIAAAVAEGAEDRGQTDG